MATKKRRQKGNGTYIDDKGYPRISAGPLRGVRVHTLVAEAMLRRKLKKDEVVHHKDLNKKNARWTNLKVMDSSAHNAVSAAQYWILKNLGIKELREWNAYFFAEDAETAFDTAEFEIEGNTNEDE